MYKDEILEEIWRIKDAHAAQYGYDLDKMVKDLQERQWKSGHKVVSFEKKKGSQRRRRTALR